MRLFRSIRVLRPQSKTVKQERNSPCACGSGLKHKKCCGSGAAVSKKYHDDKEQLMERLRENRVRREKEDSERSAQGLPTRRSLLPLMAIMAASTGIDPRILK